MYIYTELIKVLSEVSILPSAEPIHGQNITLKCVSTPFPNLRKLIPYLTLEWVVPDGAVKDNVVTGVQMYSTDEITLNIELNPFTASHSGVYTCLARLNISNSVGNHVTTKTFDLTLHSKSDKLCTKLFDKN